MSSTAFPSHPIASLRGATSLAVSQRQLHFALSEPVRTKNTIMVETEDMAPERHDMLALRQAHGAIQDRRQRSQPAVRRYQALRERSIGERPLWPENAAVRVHLNPLRAWCRLRTSKFLAPDVPPPAAVLLYAVGDDFATKVFDLEEQTLINELADYQPCTLDQWSKLSALATRDQLVSLCEELHESGLIRVSEPNS